MIQSVLVNKVSVFFVSLFIALSGAMIFSVGSSSALFDCPDTLTGSEMSRCQACSGAGGAAYVSGEGCLDDTKSNGKDQVNTMIETVINVLSLLVGVASVIMIMIGGFKYVTSQGDSNNITSAKNTILYAIIGLVVVAMAQIIVIFVISKATADPKTKTTTTFIQQAA